MRVIGLTGGIACGKSTVSDILRSFGAAIIDADALAHALAEPGRPLYQAYVAHWGKGILTEEGALDRRRIGAIVFQDDSERAWLNDTAQPILYHEACKRLHALQSEGAATVILDAPLLLEAGWDRLTDEIWVVFIPRALQLQRLMARDHYTEAEALHRVDSQMTMEERLRRADVVIDNRGTEMELRQRVYEAFHRKVV